MDTKKLRQKILDLAIHGKLVPQDPNDEPASVLLERIRVEKERLISEGKIKHSRKTVRTTDTHHYEQDMPFEVPQGWVWCKLDDLAFYKKGPFGSSLTKSMFVLKGDNTYKVYEQKNAIQKNEKLGTYYISKEKYQELIAFAIQPFDIIVSCAGTIGETFVLPQEPMEGIINQALMLVRLYNRDIEKFYLLYFDYILKEEAYKESKGTAIKNIPPFDVLKNFYIPLPPFSEQQRIVAEIGRWFALIDTIEQGKVDLQTAIKQAKSKILDLAIHGKLVQQNPNDEPASELLKRINPKAQIPCDNGHSRKLPPNWIFTKIKNVFKINPRTQADDDMDVAFVPMANISDGFRSLFTYDIRKWGGIKSGFTHFQNGDIAVAKISPCLENRKSVVFNSLPNGLGAGTTELHIFRPLGIDVFYALYFFKSNSFIKLCVGSFNGVVGQQRIGKAIIENISFPLPPLAEQKRIVRKIEDLFSLINIIEMEIGRIK